MTLSGLLYLSACGGGSIAPGGGSSSGPPIAGAASNVQTITVDSGPAALSGPSVDTAYTTVTICVPGTTTCQTIDHIQVDTGSSGLRILASALTLSLPQQTDASSNPIAECTQFVDGFSWGPIKTADIQISGEVAPDSAVQVIGDPAYPTIPTACASTGNQEDTVATFGANGILGVGVFIQDCGQGCAAAQNNGIYYDCPSSSTCGPAAMPLASQVLNPVAAFTTDNNGVIVELPAITASGASSVTGALVFGIDTQSNNGLGTAEIFTVDDNMGFLTTQYKGTSFSQSFIDSGSTAYFFHDGSIGTCPSNSSGSGFYCPSGTLNLSATLVGQNNATATVNFNIGNATDLFNSSTTVTALNNLGADNTNTDSFDWGLPFFFGRNVVFAIEQHNTSGGEGPYIAY
jgi:hypothetical protein